MVYECDECSRVLPAGVTACPNCGEKFDEAVPIDAELPKRGFSPAAPLPHSVASPSPVPLSVAPLSAPIPPRQRQGSYDWLEPPPSASPRVPGDGSPAHRVLGALFLLGGLALTIYFFAVFDTSLALPTGSASILGIERVNNLGLMAERQNGIIMGMGSAILGAILIFAGLRK